MNTAVREACAFGAELSLYETVSPFSTNAVEHSAVDVSISIILSMSVRLIVPCEHFLEIWENGVGHIFQRREEDRLVQSLFGHKMECIVKRTECHDDQSDDQTSLQQRE